MAISKERFYVACVGALMLLTNVSSGHTYYLTKPKASERSALSGMGLSQIDKNWEGNHIEKSQNNQLALESVSPFSDTESKASIEISAMPSIMMATITSTSGGTGNWNDPDNWDSAQVPAPGDDVIIDAGHNITIDVATAQCANITINSGGTLTIAGTGALSVSANLINNGTISTSSGSLITISGNWTNNGTFTDGGTTVTFDTDGSLISGTTSFLNLVIDTGGDITTSVSIDSDVTINELQLTSGLLKINSGTTSVTGLNSSTSHKIPEPAGIEVNTGGTLITGDFSITNEGLIRINNGTATFGNSFGNSIETQVDGAFIVNGGTVEIAGRLHNSASGELIPGLTSGITISGGMITLTTIGQGLSGTGSLNVTSAGNFDFSAGTIIFENPNSSGGTAMDLQLLSGGGSKNIDNAASFQFGNSSTLANNTFVINSEIDIPNLTTYNSNSTIELANDLTISNSVSLNSGVSLNGNSIRLPITTLGPYGIPLEDGNGNSIPVSGVLNSGTILSGAYIEFSTSENDHPNNASSANYLTRYWTATVYGVSNPNYDVTTTYLDNDVTGSESEIAAGIWTGSLPWLKDANVNAGSNTISFSGITLEDTEFSLTGITSDPPAIDINEGTTASICVGESFNITTTFSGDPTPTYSWSPTTGLDDPNIANPVASPTTTTTYTVTVTDGNGFTATDDIAITVEPNSTIIISSAAGTDAQSICINAAITDITYNTTGATGAAFSNLPNGVNGSWASDLVTISGTPTETGAFNYTITLTGGCGTIEETGSINVNPIPDVTPSPSAETICSGNATNIALSSSIAGTSFSWTVTQTDVTGAFDGSGTTIAQNLTATGSAPGTVTYTITPTANGCSGTPVNVTVTVNPIPAVDGPANQVVCNGNATSSVIFSGTVPGTTYNWTNNNTSIGLLGSGTGNISSFTAVNTGATVKNATITVTPVYTNGGKTCSGSPQSFTITVNPTPTVNKPADQELCNGENTTTVSFSGNATSYSWINDNTAIGLAASGTSNSIASFIATNTGSSPITATITVTPVYSNGGTDCTGTQESFTITVNPSPTADPVSNQNYCDNTTTTAIALTGSPSTGLTFDISGGASIGLANQTDVTEIPAFTTTPGSATITITPKANGCSGTPITFNITIQTEPTAGAINPDQSICPNTLPSTFNSVPDGTGDGTISYIWEKSTDDGANWTPISGVSTKYYTSPSLSQTTWFRRTTVSTVNGFDCLSEPTNIVEVIAYDDEPPTFDPPADITVYTNGSCVADTTTSSTGTVTVKDDNCTNPNDIIVEYSDDPIVAGTCAGTYSFVRHWTLTDLEDNSDTKDQTITIADNTKPIVTKPADKSISCDQSTDPSHTGQATATDNCDSNPTITYSDVITAGTCTNNYTITRSWIATDCSGNVSIVRNQTINIIDGTSPLASIADIYVDLSTEELPYPYADLNEFLSDGGTVTDNCSSNVQFEFRDDYAFGLDDVAGYCPDSIWRYYRFTDDCGNYQDLVQSVIITDKGNCSPCIYNNSFFVVDLLGDPEGTLELTARRQDKCCDTPLPGNVECISFNIRLDEDAVGLEILVQGGAPDFKDWKVDCEELNVSNGIVCISGGGFHLFTFCKQGNNPNEYTFNSIPGVIASDDITTRVECDGQISTEGITGNPVWTSIWPGTRGQYDSYLSNITNSGATFIAEENSPPEIHYEVCAEIGSSVCNALGVDCDTITVYVHQKIEASFNEDPTTICSGDIPILTVDVSPAGATYIYEWYVGHDATGSPFLTGTDSYQPSTEGEYSLKVTDTENGIPCSSEVFNFEVIFDHTGISNFTIPYGDLNLECNQSNSSQLIQAWLNSASAVDYDGTPVAVTNDYTGITQACGTVLPVTFSAADVCGNLGDTTLYIRIDDTTKPVLTKAAINSDAECEGTDPSSNSGYLAWLASHGAATANDVCDNNLVWTNNSASQSWSGNAASNEITVTFTATDDCGNFVETTATYTVHDTEPPTITCPPDAEEIAGPGVCTKTLATVTDPTNISDLCSTPTLSWTMSGATTGSGSGTVTGKTFNVGTTTVTYTATDAAGLTATCQFNVTILDVVPPQFNAGCPLSDIGPINAEPDLCDAYVNVPVPDVTDICGEGYTITNDFNNTGDASGRYDVGTTTVTWTITDASGNPTTCSQDITVVDNQDPEFLTCPGSVSETIDPNNCSKENVTITDPTFSDNCPNPVLSYELILPDGSTTSSTGSVSGLTFDVGITTVNYTITDAAGRFDECSFTVEIKRLDIPEAVITCPTNPAPVSAQTGSCDALVSPDTPSISDPCATATYTVMNNYNNTDDATDTYPVGTTEVEWTITDNSGNIKPCTQYVTVTDDEKPTLTCPAPVSETVAANECSKTGVTIGSVSYDDNCPNPVLSYKLTGATVDSGTGPLPSSQVFNVGITSVKYIVTDASDNKDSCEFIVEIKHIDIPESSFTCPTDTVRVDADPSACDAFVNLTPPSIIDPCNEIVSVTHNSSFSADPSDASGTYPTDTTNITWTITDFAGNTEYCEQVVIVNLTMTLNAPNPQEFCQGETTPVIALTGAPAGAVFDITGGSSIGLSDQTGVSQIPSFTALPSTETITITPRIGSCVGIPVDFEITVHPAPGVTATPAAPTVCSGETTNILLENAIAASTFSWEVINMSPAGSIIGVFDDTGNVIAQTPINTTTSTATFVYRVTPHLSGCSGAQLSVLVTVHPDISATISGGATLCQDGAEPEIAFTANGGTPPYTFTYNINGGSNQQITTATGDNSITLNAQTDVAGTFNYNLVSVVSNESCLNNQTGTATVIVNATPTLTSGLTPSGICSNEPFYYTPTANVSGTTFSWSRATIVGISNPAESGTNDISETLTNTTNAPIAVTYTFDLATPDGCINTEDVVVMVTPTPLLTSSDPTEPICSGETFSYIPTSNVTSGVTFSWSRPAIAGNPATSGTGAISETLINNTGSNVGITYTYTLSSNDCNNPVTYNVPIVVVPAPTVIASASETTICLGESVNLSSSSNISATQLPTLLSEDFNSASAGDYNGPNGWTTSYTDTDARWTVRDDNFSHHYRTFSSNDNSKFYLTSSRIAGNGSFESQLISPAMNTTGYTSLNLSFWHYYRNGDSTDHPRIEVSTDGSNWDEIEELTYTRGSSDSFSNYTANLSGYIGNTTFYIRFRFSGDQTDYYWAIDNVEVTGTPASVANINWTSSPAGFSSTEANPTNVVPSETTTYTVTYTDPDTGCNGEKSVTVTVRESPDATISADYCVNPPYIRLTTGSFSSYLWSNGATTQYIDVDVAGNFFITVTDANGCTGSASINIANELVVNGDFSAGNSGFTSGYGFRDPWVTPPAEATSSANSALWDENYYGVGENARYYHTNFWGKDHTTGDGNFMIVNGNTNAGTPIWEQTVIVEPNTDYYFSAWSMSLNSAGNDAVLQFEVNGVLVGTQANLPAGVSNDSNSGWIQFYSNPKWNSGSVSGPITIRIMNVEPAAGGNDFGLDDISFGTLDPSPATISPYAEATELCAGDTIRLFANRDVGKEPFTYTWSGPNGYSSTEENPVIPDVTTTATGTYTLVITDGYGCDIDPGEVTVTVNPPATVDAGEDQEVCANAAEVTLEGAIGGAASSASWSGGNGSFTPNANTLNAVYTPSNDEITAGSVELVLTTDNPAGACPEVRDTMVITIYEVADVTLTPTSPKCKGGNNGSIATAVIGGVGPYTYLWSNGQTTASATGLTAGNYSVTVTDAMNCEVTESMTLVEPDMFVVSTPTFTQPSCFGADDATATVTATGGTGPYQYLWDAAAGSQTTATATGLTAGTYSVQVSDANGCAASSFLVTISQPAAPTLTCPKNTVFQADFEEDFASNKTIADPVLTNTCPDYTLIWEMNLPDGSTSSSALTGQNIIPSPATYNVGVTNITYTMSDDYGNNLQCSFTVTVEAEPEIDCPDPVVQTTDADVCTATLDPGQPSLLSGNADEWKWSVFDADNNEIDDGTGNAISPIPYTFDEGVITIRWIASNVSGADTCYQTITINDEQPPTFTSSNFEACVDNLSHAQYASSMLEISPDPDHYTFKAGSTALDLTDISDNCCAEAEMEINWRIDFANTPDPGGGILTHPPITGTGQPSTYVSDIQLWGDGVNFTNVIHTITYWIEDCHGNTTAEEGRAITITPRPQIN